MSQEQREQLVSEDVSQLGASLLLWLGGDEADLERNLTEERGLLPLEGVADG